jgi:regulator of protease activity HflC (stomatin/prohibitin superfamily)
MVGLNGKLVRVGDLCKHSLGYDMIEYDVREKTIVERFEFNDKNSMLTVVELALDFRLNPDKLTMLHTQITDVQTKILKTLKSAGKEVVPQYSAIELNIHKRTEAEEKLSNIMKKELGEFYVDFARIQMTDVDIPGEVAKLAEETAVQLGRNELALKKEAEQTALAQAEIARAKGAYEAAQYDAKTKDILSQPKMLELQRIENERIIAEGYKKHGKSIYGEHNYFGASAPVLLKELNR